MTEHAQVPAVGDVVSYEDMENADRLYIIVGLPVDRVVNTPDPTAHRGVLVRGKSGYFLRPLYRTDRNFKGCSLRSGAPIAAIIESDLRQAGWSIWSDDLQKWIEIQH